MNLRKIGLGLIFVLSTNMFGYDCEVESNKIMDMYNAKKYKEISDTRLDDNFAWNCKTDYNMLIMLGTMHFHKTKDNFKAGSFFEQAMKANPKLTRAYLNLAAVKIKDKDFDDAVELCEKQL